MYSQDGHAGGPSEREDLCARVLAAYALGPELRSSVLMSTSQTWQPESVIPALESQKQETLGVRWLASQAELELQIWRENPASESDKGRHLTSTSDLHVHIYVCTHRHVLNT